MRRAVTGLTLALLVGGAAACDGSDGGAEPAPDVKEPTQASPPTAWTEGATGTTKTPAYGVSCRLAVEDVLTVVSTGAADDALTLSAPDTGAAALTLTVAGPGGPFEAQVSLARALLDKSYREATGTASLGGEAFTVVDGTLCFAERLATGQAVDGELSLVLKTASGSYRSVAGTFTLPGAAVDTDAEPAQVTASALDVDLR